MSLCEKTYSFFSRQVWECLTTGKCLPNTVFVRECPFAKNLVGGYGNARLPFNAVFTSKCPLINCNNFFSRRVWECLTTGKCPPARKCLPTFVNRIINSINGIIRHASVPVDSPVSFADCCLKFPGITVSFVFCSRSCPVFPTRRLKVSAGAFIGSGFIPAKSSAFRRNKALLLQNNGSRLR